MVTFVFAVSLDFPSDNLYYNKSNLVLSCTGLGNISLYVDGILKETKMGSELTNFSINSTDGFHVWNCYSDNETNFASVNKTFVVDTIAPSVEILNHLIGTPLNLTFSIIELNLNKCYYSLNSLNETVNCYENITLNLGEGNYSFEYFVLDKSGNSNSDNISFEIKELTPFVIDKITFKKYMDWTNFTLFLIVDTSSDSICKFSDSSVDFENMNLFDATSSRKHNISFFNDVSLNKEYYVKCKNGDKIVSNSSKIEVNFESFVFEGGLIKSWNEIETARRLVFETSEDLNSLQEVEVSLVHPITNAKVRVEELNETGLENPKNEVFIYFKIDWLNIEKPDYDLALIKFKVGKDWLEENNLSVHDVVLLRYNEGWEEQQTYFKKRYGTDYFFETQVEGFSYFAVSSKIKSFEKTVHKEERQIEVVPETVEEVIEEKNSSFFLVVILLSFLFLLGFGGYIYSHRKDFGK